MLPCDYTTQGCFRKIYKYNWIAILELRNASKRLTLHLLLHASYEEQCLRWLTLFRMQRRRRWVRAPSFSNFSRLDFFDLAGLFFLIFSSNGKSRVVCCISRGGVANTFMAICHQIKLSERDLREGKKKKLVATVKHIEYDRDLIAIYNNWTIWCRLFITAKRWASAPALSIWTGIWARLLILATWLVLRHQATYLRISKKHTNTPREHRISMIL